MVFLPSQHWGNGYVKTFSGLLVDESKQWNCLEFLGRAGFEGARGQRKWRDLSHLCCLFAEQRQEGAAG